mgnify:FL=1
MRYVIITALVLLLLAGTAAALPSEVVQSIEATATGGDLYQEGSNYIYEAGGEGAVVTQTIALSADATGEVAQAALNEAGDVDFEAGEGGIYGDGAVVTQSTTMTATGTDIWQNYGYIYDESYWLPGNFAIVYGNGAVVTQSLNMDATGENVWQNFGEYFEEGSYFWPSNIAEVYGEGTTTTQTIDQTASAEEYVWQMGWNLADPDAGSLATQSISQAAVAGGDIEQQAANDAYFYGDGAVAIQSVLMDAMAGGFAYQGGDNYADMGNYESILVDQSATLNAVAGDWVNQYFDNMNYDAGSNTVSTQAVTAYATGTDIDQNLYNHFETDDPVSEGTQVITAGASATDGDAYQYAYNWMYTYGNDILGQSIILNAVATDTVWQYGDNYGDLYDNLDLGQEVWLSGDGAYVYQNADNQAYFGDFADIAQYVALSAISDDEGVYQYADNYAENEYAYAESTNNIGQEITGAAMGGDASYQNFFNYAELTENYWYDPGMYNVTQVNVATLAADDYAGQYQSNWIDWWYPNTGSIAMDMMGDASADELYQYHENWIEMYY